MKLLQSNMKLFRINLTQAAISIVLISSLVSARPENKNEPSDTEYDTDENQNSDNGNPNVDNPDFISTNQSITAKVGDSVQITCQVNKLEPQTQLMWQVKYETDKSNHEPIVIKVGNTWLGTVDRNRFHIDDLKVGNDNEGSILKISDVDPNDAGVYICTIAVEDKKSIYTKLQVKPVGEQETLTKEVTSGSQQQISSQSSVWLSATALLCSAIYRR